MFVIDESGDDDVTATDVCGKKVAVPALLDMQTTMAFSILN